MTLAVGDEVNLSVYEKKLVKLGYERCAQAESAGQFAVRGGIYRCVSVYGGDTLQNRTLG